VLNTFSFEKFEKLKYILAPQSSVCDSFPRKEPNRSGYAKLNTQRGGWFFHGTTSLQ
jgi:hypothetical protein